MKLKIMTLFIFTIIAAGLFSYGCGGGSDASFSPDPTVAGMPGGDNPPDGTGGGGADGGENSGESGKDTQERDCFLDGFCYRICKSAAECPEGFSCIMNVCTFDCQSDDECGAGGECSDAGLCEAVTGEEIPACTQNSECGDGRFCNDEGGCEQVPVLFGCVNDADCPLGQYCSETHECVLFPSGGVACSRDADCPGNYYCGATGSCEQECRSDYQCSAGNACNTDGRCTTAGLPMRLASFSFNAMGADSDPAAPAVFESASYKIDMVEIVPAGRGEILSSPNYRLIRSGATAPSEASPSNTIPYEGHLANATGLDLDRNVRIEIRVYDSLMAGIGQGVSNAHVIYAEDHPVVEVDEGIFRLNIGSGASLKPEATLLPVDRLLETENVYIELWIDGERLSPRQRVGSMPAVFHAKYAHYADEVENMPTITEAMLPNYPAELITAGTFSEECIPSGLDVGLITGTLNAARLPAVPVDNFATTGSIPSGMIGAMDAAKIVGGTIRRDMLPAGSYVARENLIVLSGSVSNEQMLVFPSGFDPASECQHILTPSVTMGSVEGIDQIYLDLNSDKVVRCEVDWHEAEDGETHTVPCTANYMIICKK